MSGSSGRQKEAGPLWDADRVQALRRHMGLTQDQMADHLGVRQQTVSEWETGAYRPRGASARLLHLIAERARFPYAVGKEAEPGEGQGAMSAGRLRVGCCGFAGAMAEYFRLFPVVEVQQTFYRPPRLETARCWREEAPPGFQFTVKAWQLITHHPGSPTYQKAGLRLEPGTEERYGFFRPTDEVRRAWEATREVAEALAARVVVFQCPARFRPEGQNLENMRRFFGALRGCGLVLAWEPRGPEWDAATVAGLCAELGLVHCGDPLESPPVTGPPYYLRLHGGPGYWHQYTDDELQALARRWDREEGYLLFNNLTMRQDAERLLRVLSREGAKL